MSVRSGQSIVVEFTTASFSTGAATNADTLPTGTLVVNGVDNAATVTVTNVDTGRYKAAVTLPTLAIGDIVELSIAATVSTVAGKGIVWRDTKDVLLDASGDVTFNNTSIATVTTVTNQLTAAQIATGVWQDATAGDFTTAGSIGKSLFTSGNAPGAASGLALVGSNVGTATSVSGSVGSVTGNVGGSVVGDVQGKVLGGGASAITGVGVDANATQSAGTTIHNSDGTLASATASTVTFPTTDSAGNTIPDDARFEYTVLQIVAGTGIGQTVLLTVKSGVRTFNILSGTAPVLLDATSQYIVVGSWRAELELWLGSAPNALISGRMDSNTQATAASLAYNLTGNITGNLSGTVTTATNLTNLPSIPTNWLTASGIAAGALNGKGDWLLASSAPTNFSSLAITVGGAVTAGTVSDKTGYALSSAGLDSITIETSLNARQALSIIASASAGVLAGAATTSVTIAAAGVPATNRLTATCDSNGNRTAVTLNPPA